MHKLLFLALGVSQSYNKIKSRSLLTSHLVREKGICCVRCQATTTANENPLQLQILLGCSMLKMFRILKTCY